MTFFPASESRVTVVPSSAGSENFGAGSPSLMAVDYPPTRSANALKELGHDANCVDAAGNDIDRRGIGPMRVGVDCQPVRARRQRSENEASGAVGGCRSVGRVGSVARSGGKYRVVWERPAGISQRADHTTISRKQSW